MKTTITFDDKHLPVIIKALEAYERFKMGQVDYFLDIVSDNDISYEDRQEIHKLVRAKMFPKLEHSQSYGIGNKEVGDGQIAYEISKVLENYVSVKRNDGYWGNGTNFYEPLKYSELPLPVVHGFKKYIDFIIDLKYYDSLAPCINNGDFRTAWKVIDEWKAEAANPELLSIKSYEKAEIVRSKEFLMGKGCCPSDVWLYRLHKPRK